MNEKEFDGEEGRAEGDSSERWLVSFADFMTLLFAMFVMLYAMSMKSQAHLNRAWTAMATAMGVRPHRGGIRPDFGATTGAAFRMPGALMRPLQVVGEEVQSSMKQFHNPGVTVRIDARGLVISLSAAKFFASGEAGIAASQIPVLTAVADKISGLPNPMRVEGFTDSVPIHNSHFADNWALSSARAQGVLRFLVAHADLVPRRMSLAGYGPYRPVASNDTEEGRALNRRVEIIVQPLRNGTVAKSQLEPSDGSFGG